MNKELVGENWIEIKFDFEFSNSSWYEISNYGRLRSFNKTSDGKILKGSTLNGYSIHCIKLFKPKSKAAQKRFDYFKSQISQLSGKIALTKQRIKDKVRDDNVLRKYKRDLKQELELRDLMKENYNHEVRTDELKRTINKTLLTHKMVALNFCKKPSDHHIIVIHLDYNKLNNRFNNLKWATQTDSTTHQQNSPKVKAAKGNRKGKQVDGAKHYKLTETKVMLIKKKINQGVKLSSLSKQFKVSETQLLRIKRGINWGNVKAAA